MNTVGTSVHRLAVYVVYCRYMMANTDLNNSVELLEIEIEKLKKSTGDKLNKVTGLTRLLQQLNEVDVQKTVKIQTIVLQLNKFEKELDLLNDNIASLEQITEQLILEIQKLQEQIDEVTIFFSRNPSGQIGQKICAEN